MSSDLYISVLELTLHKFNTLKDSDKLPKKFTFKAINDILHQCVDELKNDSEPKEKKEPSAYNKFYAQKKIDLIDFFTEQNITGKDKINHINNLWKEYKETDEYKSNIPIKKNKSIKSSDGSSDDDSKVAKTNKPTKNTKVIIDSNSDQDNKKSTKNKVTKGPAKTKHIEVIEVIISETDDDDDE
jgi:hypothetical protein